MKAFAQCPKTTTPKPPSINYRLQTSLKPTLYEIELQPFIGPKEVYGDKAFTTIGKVIMHFECKKPTDRIEFHAKDLTIDAEKFKIRSNSHPELYVNGKSMKYDAQREIVSIDFNMKCKEGAKYELDVHFNGIIANKLYGFYRSSYVDIDGKTH